MNSLAVSSQTSGSTNDSENFSSSSPRGTGESIPLVCQDWANTKAAYRFLSNHRVNEGDILAGHFQSTHERFAATHSTVLVLHDTTEFNYHREDIRSVGILHRLPVGRHLNGQLQHYVVCGIQMHSSLAVTTDGLPLGLTAMKFWTRSKFTGCNALKKKINPTRVPIEKKESIRWLENLQQSTALLNDPERCVHIGDRESDIYELFCRAKAVGTHFLVRTCVDRLAGEGKHTIADEMREVRIQGLHRIPVTDQKGHQSKAILEIRYHRIRVLPPIGKQKQYPELMLTVIHAQERGAPIGRERIDWKLITDLPVRSRDEAVEKLKWYSMRWKIETFHKILKSEGLTRLKLSQTWDEYCEEALIVYFKELSFRHKLSNLWNRINGKPYTGRFSSVQRSRSRSFGLETK